MRKWTDIYARSDWLMMLAALSLTAIGLLAIYGINVSHTTGELFQFKKQLLGAGIGVVVASLLTLVDFRHLRALSLPIYIGGALLLLAALIFGTTIRSGGKWFTLGSLSFQPVEMAKVTLAIFLAGYLSRYAHGKLSWTAFLGSGLATAGYLGLILLQPDFGSGMVLVAMWLAAVLFCGLPRHAWWILLVTITSASLLLWNFGLKPYQRDRIASFVNPQADPYGASYNVAQAQIAIGSGGWLGKGIGEGSQARLRFLPEASTDFMFAVIGEELGFVGLMVMLSLFGLLMFRFLRVAMLSKDAFASILLVSLSAFIAFHLAVNAGMNLGISPVTGIPLPFVSAAASSLVVMFATVGLAEAVAVRCLGSQSS